LIASKKYESNLIEKLQSGKDYVLLPETPEQFNAMTELLTTKKSGDTTSIY
jgi:hypothetical protein